ncbi:MAG TPA: SET domain-containing protein [Chitinophagaceae bacterium]|nr:SET domain-containing protein [Chitinophagaceae bacterium]
METSPETVIVKDSKFGKGIFAPVYLPKKSVLFKIKGKPITFEETLKLGEDECYTLQVTMDKYIIPDHPFHLSNHSCQPNCGINRKMEFITLQDINAGEELCWDYSTSMMERHWTLQCNCGYPDCRHIIGDFDLLPAPVQERYLDMRVVLPFIIEELYGLPTIERANYQKMVATGK